MRAGQFCVLATAEPRVAMIWRWKSVFAPPPPSGLGCCPFWAVVMLLLVRCLMRFPLFVGVLLCVNSSFAIILKRKRKLVALLAIIVLRMYCIILRSSSSWCRGLACM